MCLSGVSWIITKYEKFYFINDLFKEIKTIFILMEKIK